MKRGFIKRTVAKILTFTMLLMMVPITLFTGVLNVNAAETSNEYIHVIEVYLSRENMQLKVGNQEYLIATILPFDATNKNIKWTSSDSSIVTVDDNGLLTGIACGNATVTATTEDRGYTASCKIVVTKEVPVVSNIVTRSLVYNGRHMRLTSYGQTTGGTLYYGISTSETEVPTEWTTYAPVATDKGTYHIWYKVIGNEYFFDSPETYAGTSKIMDATKNVIATDFDTNKAVVKDAVKGTNETVPIECITEGEVYRMYDPYRGEHFYTKLVSERDNLIRAGWYHEYSSNFSVVDATDDDAIPVYRLYNPNDGGMHFYTENASEARSLMQQGWNYEGISHYVYANTSDKGIEQYRLYNPGSSNGEHNWTANPEERRMNISVGWQDEGVCWRII